jgi:hypothetical protein
MHDNSGDRMPTIAAIVTEYRPRSHADVIVGKLLAGYLLDGVPTTPRVRVAGMYVEQFPPNDMARELAREHSVPIYHSIRDALTLGGASLAVDGILLIGEHGEYPLNDRGQKLYPRYRFFREATAVMAESGRVVPTFSDKHLSWSWVEAEAIYRESRRLNLPFTAGSSLPFTWRRPPLVLPLDSHVDEALVVGYGPLESYGFHALETLQSMVERRRSGETGVEAVRCARGSEVWSLADAGWWSAELQAAALGRTKPLSAVGPEAGCAEPAAFLIEYRDGLRATVLMLDGYLSEFAFAVRLAGGNVVSTQFYLQSTEPFGHFAFLVNRFEDMVISGRPSYPIERTLLTTGALCFLMESAYRGGERIETPMLGVAYRSNDE